MRICLIGPVPPFRGGIAKYCYSLAKELESRHSLLLLSYKRQYPAILYGNKSQVDEDINRAGIAAEFTHLSFDIDSSSIVSWFKTAREITVFKPDLVVLPWWVSYWAPLYLYLFHTLKARGIKVVFLCINVFEHENSALKNFLTRLTLRNVPAIIVHSEQEIAEIRAFNRKAVVKKHLLPLFEYTAEKTPNRETEFNLLFFGFVRPYKGLDTLLAAISRLKNRSFSLTIAGEFWNDKDTYLKLIEDLGIADKIVIIDQYIPDSEISRYFCRADLVVLPYKETKTSGIIATAYGFGKPVLATDVGGFQEIILDSATGKIVPPDDPQAFAEGIVWFLDHRDIDFAKNISRFAEQSMSWGSLADLIETFSPVGIAN